MQRALPSADAGRFAPWLLVFIALYVALMLWSDRNYQLGDKLMASGWVLAGILPLIFVSLLLRYQRWRMLLSRMGRHTGFGAGFLAYLAGFALTASPGKAGELIRIRYFARLGVRSDMTVAAFVYERASDLVVVLGLSLLVASRVPALGWVVGAILAVVTAIICLSWHPRHLKRIRRGLMRAAPAWTARPFGVLLGGFAKIGPLLNARTVLGSLFIGTVAWLMPSIAFAGLCTVLGIQLPLLTALGIYPAAMLVGALSFVPGGIGTTEAATILMLTSLGVGLPEALAAAVGIRLTTLWFATLLGAGCIVPLEGLRR